MSKFIAANGITDTANSIGFVIPGVSENASPREKAEALGMFYAMLDAKKQNRSVSVLADAYEARDRNLRAMGIDPKTLTL